MSDEIVDEVVAMRSGGNGPAARKVVSDVVDGISGASTTSREAEGIEQDDVREGARFGRPLKESTKALLAKLGGAAPATESAETVETEDVDDGEGDGEASDPDDQGLVDEAASDAEGAETEEVETVKEEKPEPVDEVRAAYSRLEASNRQLAAALEAERTKPRAELSDRYKTFDAADQAYVDEGTVPALRKFIAAVIGAAPDSKEVDAELSGVYVDLTAQEVGVPLEENAKAKRDVARARLALARDKRERAEREKAPAAPTANEERGVTEAAPFIENRLATKRDGGKSFADEYPLLMTLAETIDGMKPGELIARVIQREAKIGTLDTSIGNDGLIQAASKMIEAHYQALAERISKAKPKTDTTMSGDPKKTATAQPASKEQRQSTGARTITNASASVAPATSPKPKKPTTSSAEKTRKDFKSDREWRKHLLNKHMSG